MTQINTAPRIRGLDTLRALAIVLVLMSHYAGFVSHRPVFGVAGDIGWAGVDLFFVLSGYLIGNQILSVFARGEHFSFGLFFVRRLLRTLPDYYVVLAAYFLFPALLNGSAVAPLWRFLSFTQNIGLAYGETFTRSWSLCVEEQFYLILPLVLLCIFRSRHAVRLLWCVIVAAIAAGMAFRGIAFASDGHGAFSAEVYYSSFARFDELLPGVAIALLKNFHSSFYARMLRYGNLWLAMGIALAAGVLTCLLNDAPTPLLATGFGFSLLAMSFALLTLSALSPASLLNRLPVPGAARLALWSYAIYLVHKPVFMLIGVQLKRIHVDTGAPLTIVAVMLTGILGGWIVFRLVETPFMQLRERWFPWKPGVNRALTAP